MPQGFLSIVLHAHLPFVRHPEYPTFLEEDWLFEAITECYLPLIAVLHGLAEDQVPCHLTLSISPTLAEMLNDTLLQTRYQRYLESRMELADQEVERTRHDLALQPLAVMYRQFFGAADRVFEQYRGNLLSAFRQLQDEGLIEIITCPATHAFLPFVSNKEARRAQLVIARETCEHHFGKSPRGLWLAECGYEPGLEPLVRESGFAYLALDTHGLLFGNPRPPAGIYAPVKTPEGLVAFGRDLESSRQVWSSHGGYPGDADYREFYRDLGYDGHYESLRPYLHADGVRRNLGIKYHRVTGPGDLGQRALYHRKSALAKAEEHAKHFVQSRQEQFASLRQTLGQPPIVVSPYDAELFGHWWLEGPHFLDQVIRKSASTPSQFKLATLSEVLDEYPNPVCLQPAASSWGELGFQQVWLNERTQWLYRHQHQAERCMVDLAKEFPEAEGPLRRALNQAARELLLAQSSDWPFLISQQTAVPYAMRRFREHIHRFHQLREQISSQAIEEGRLQVLESQDSVFPRLDYRVFCGQKEFPGEPVRS
jgi:1,4-alpha-glucan branching enzyme